MIVRNWGASSIAADKIADAHKMAFEIFGLFNFFFILFSISKSTHHPTSGSSLFIF
tara:strand:+ start:2962 stop:3129 length:168 start_codon:yes stop_codon:yes gene_type:complete